MLLRCLVYVFYMGERAVDAEADWRERRGELLLREDFDHVEIYGGRPLDTMNLSHLPEQPVPTPTVGDFRRAILAGRMSALELQNHDVVIAMSDGSRDPAILFDKLCAIISYVEENLSELIDPDDFRARLGDGFCVAALSLSMRMRDSGLDTRGFPDIEFVIVDQSRHVIGLDFKSRVMARVSDFDTVSSPPHIYGGFADDYDLGILLGAADAVRERNEREAAERLEAEEEEVARAELAAKMKVLLHVDGPRKPDDE